MSYWYYEDDRIMEKYSKGLSRSGHPITTIVLHAAMGRAKGIIQWMLDGGVMPDGSKREKDYYNAIGMFHFINDRDGTIYRVIDEINFVWGSQAKDEEVGIVAIENCKINNDNSDTLTEAQYQSLASFIYNLRMKYPTIYKIRTHDYYRARIGIKPKPCPGNFDWTLFENNMEFLNMKLTKIGECDYKI